MFLNGGFLCNSLPLDFFFFFGFWVDNKEDDEGGRSGDALVMHREHCSLYHVWNIFDVRNELFNFRSFFEGKNLLHTHICYKYYIKKKKKMIDTSFLYLWVK